MEEQESMGATSKLVVEAHHLSKAFGARNVFQNMNLDIVRGEFVAITGKSGSGKSTLLNIIGLLDGEFGGSLRLFDEKAPKPGSRGARKLLQQKIAYLFQEPALINEASVEANIKLAQYYARKSAKEDAAKRAEALQEVGLIGSEKEKVYQLSGGEQQRLALACLRVRPCDLVLADEPTGSLDPDSRDKVLQLFERLVSEGKTIVVVTHDLAVAKHADRIIKL